MLERLKGWAQKLRRDAAALALAMRDPRVPWGIKALAALIVAYAFSPIDLIPDFIPVLGYLDELVLLPLAIAAVVSLIDSRVMAEMRAAAAARAAQPVSRWGAALVVGVWLIAAGTVILAVWRRL